MQKFLVSSTMMQKKQQLVTDDSSVSLGVVFLQFQNGGNLIISDANRILTNMEKRYFQTEKDIPGLIWAYSHVFICSSVKSTLNFVQIIYLCNIFAPINRCMLRLQPYRITVVYIKGKGDKADT